MKRTMLRKDRRKKFGRPYLPYSAATMNACIASVKNKKMTQREACAHYKIPRSSLNFKMKVKIQTQNPENPPTPINKFYYWGRKLFCRIHNCIMCLWVSYNHYWSSNDTIIFGQKSNVLLIIIQANDGLKGF